MQTSFDYFINDAGQRIHTVRWLPDTNQRGRVVIVHGIGEHSGRYEHVASRLTSEGFGVYALDQRGHGRSEGERLRFNSFEEPAQEVVTFVEMLLAEVPDTPLFLYGHSMGSLTCLKVLADVKPQIQQHLAGWICTGSPLWVEKITPPLVVKLGLLASWVVPDLRAIPLRISGLSRDPQVIKSYRSDPLVNNRPLPLRISRELTLTTRHLRKHLHLITLPLLVMHGSNDRLCPVEGSRLLHKQAQSPDKTLQIYDGLYHEIHNEPEQEQVFQDIVEWLTARLN